MQLVLDLVVFTLLLRTGSTLHSPFPSLQVIEKSMLAVSDVREHVFRPNKGCKRDTGACSRETLDSSKDFPVGSFQHEKFSLDKFP